MADLSILNYIQQKNDNNNVSKTSSYVDKTGFDSFNKIFEKANKDYSPAADRNNFNKTETKASDDRYNPVNDNTKKQNTVQTDNNKVENKNENSNTVQDKPASETAQKTENSAQKTEETAVSDKGEKVVKTDDTKSADTEETKDTTQDDTTDAETTDLPDENNDEQQDADDNVTTDDTSDDAVKSEITVSDTVDLDVVLDNLTPTNDIQQITPSADTITVQKSETSAAQVTTDLKVDTSDVSDDIAANNLKQTDKTQVKVQPQSEQVRIGLKVDTPQENQQVQPKAQAPADTNTTQQTSQVQNQSQAPVIQTNTEAAETVQNNNNEKIKNLKELLDRADFRENVFSRLQAMVTGVETTSGNASNNLMNNNAAEQAVKIAIENISAPQNTESANANYTKAVDSIQQPKELNKSDILSQIHTKLENMKDTGTTKVTIVLRPENLGKINLELINGKEGLIAKMTTDNAQVKELLDKNLDALKNTLGNQGVNVNNVTVKVAETQKTPDEMFSFEQQNKQQSENQSSGNPNGTDKDNQQEYEFFNHAQTAENSDEEELVTSHNGAVDYKI